MATPSNEHCIDVCNKLLRGEISAVETYEQALEKYGKEPESATLRQIRDEHQQNVETLRQNVRKMGGTPSEDSNAWGAFAKTVEGSAKLLGEDAAIAALRKGEEHGKELYEEAVDDNEVLSDCKYLIQSELLPRQLRHIEQLNRLQ